MGMGMDLISFSGAECEPGSSQICAHIDYEREISSPEEQENW